MTTKAESIMVVQKNQVEKLVLVDVMDNTKNNSLWISASAELTLHQYTNWRLHLIIRLPLNQKNQVRRILLFSTNKYIGN